MLALPSHSGVFTADADVSSESDDEANLKEAILASIDPRARVFLERSEQELEKVGARKAFARLAWFQQKLNGMTDGDLRRATGLSIESRATALAYLGMLTSRLVMAAQAVVDVD